MLHWKVKFGVLLFLSYNFLIFPESGCECVWGGRGENNNKYIQKYKSMNNE